MWNKTKLNNVAVLRAISHSKMTYQKLLKEEEIAYCANQDQKHKILPNTA